ncbi:MAG: response regulator transcription factor [Clostridia bacterium]|nr:response regulator transcription factor [Clostridia bacterium]
MNKILIIEDDKSIAELERDYLEINGFSCAFAERGEKGLCMALSEDYALVIVDIMLPDIDGFEICSRLREKKDTPIIFLSAKNNDIDKIRGLGLGADDYMTKPFSPNELVARVKAHIARHSRLLGKEGKHIISVRGLVIDKYSRRVTVNGEETAFPAKEYELLLFLAENPNRVFSKDILFDRVWGLDAVGDISTVAVHIQRVRDKIEKYGEKYIETVWGAGYRFKLQ